MISVMLRMQGQAASKGFFAGPAHLLTAQDATYEFSGNPAQEAVALRDAVAAAVIELTTLLEKCEGEAADVIAFQIAMLEDEELVAPSWHIISNGAPADGAWRMAIDAQIENFQSSDDEYFRARVSDLQDMRDRVLRCLSGGGQSEIGAGSVMMGHDVSPSIFLSHDWSQGGAIVVSGGSSTSHVAMLARSRGIPMVVRAVPWADQATARILVDGVNGVAVCDPDEKTFAEFSLRSKAFSAKLKANDIFRLKPAARKDGTRIQLLINVADPAELDHIDVASCDGVGLMRSEFLFRDGAALPDEEQQYRAYRKVLEWAGEKPVTIRTLDIGGDKPITGLTEPRESNPFLGLRGIRLTLARPDVFRVQLRALARAAVHGNLSVMLPMVAVQKEITQASALLDEVIAGLVAAGTPCQKPKLGIMAEVPAVAVAPELFKDAAFFSIGSNDLTQYTLAASRDDARVTALNDPSHPAVLRLIEGLVQYGQANSISVSLCGDMASDPKHVVTLLGLGLKSISVAPSMIAEIKQTIAEN
jgi:phosphoenolpyruvate-protein phosphotransferase (PTS system enzyme I)